jgi:intracellular septation protein A
MRPQSPVGSLVVMPPRARLAVDIAIHLAEAVLIPLGLFYGIVVTFGLDSALMAALAWAYLAVAMRLARRTKPPMLLLAATAMCTLRVVITFAASSATVYFLQPTLMTGLFAAALLLTWRWDRPLIQRLAQDFCPLPPEVLGSVPLRRCFQRLSMLWGGVLLVNAGATLGLLLTMSTTWSVPLATAASVPAFTAGLALSLLWFRRSLRAGGFQISWGLRAQPARAPK